MTGYILAPWDFSVVQAVNVTDYDLPLECFASETGSLEFEGKAKRDYSQYLFRFDGLDTMWKITEVEAGDAQSTKLAVTDQTGMLDGASNVLMFQKQFYSDTITAQMLKVLAGDISSTTNQTWDNQRSRFLYKYIQLNVDDISSVITNTIFQTADYLFGTYLYDNTYRYAVTNIYTLVSDFVAAGAKLEMTIDSRRHIPPPYGGRALMAKLSDNDSFTTAIPVYFNDGHSFLQSESYDSDVCSCFVGMGTTRPMLPSEYTFYLNSNMQTVQTNVDQINGYTKYETCTNSADALEKAGIAFGANTWKHKVEFASDKVYHLNQPVRLMLERGILNTAISKVSIKSGDDRYFYTCGELPQTAAQHIKANSWKYGQRLPHNPYKGQLVFT